MKQTLFIISAAMLNFYPASAQVYTSKASEVSFFSEAPLENIEAVNKSSSSLLNTSTGQVVFQVPIPAFVFEKDLMKEHFNENYMESEKFPKASFNGKINETVDFSNDGSHKVTATGKMNIHGVEQDRTIEGTITRNGEKFTLNSEFIVLIKDHDIKVPKVVVKNIAEEVRVKIQCEYEPYKKKSE